MLLKELFPDDSEPDSKSKPGPMAQQLRQSALDFITPLLGQNIPFVTIQQVVDNLNSARFGIVVTPAIVMDILDPSQVKAIDKIEGDRIYLTKPGASSSDREVAQDQKEKDDEHVSDMAVDQINKDLKP